MLAPLGRRYRCRPRIKFPAAVNRAVVAPALAVGETQQASDSSRRLLETEFSANCQLAIGSVTEFRS
jgi:hypothetical protein